MCTVLLALLFAVARAEPGDEPPQGTASQDQATAGTLLGTLRDDRSRAPIEGAALVLDGVPTAATSAPDGSFRVLGVVPGRHTLTISCDGYATVELVILVVDGSELDIGAIGLPSLSQRVVEEIVVTPGTFSMARHRGVSASTMTGEQARDASFTEDPTGAVARLPGVSSSDFSSKFTVRGGEDDEVLITLDGMPLYEPFHQRDYSGGLFSIVDIETLDGIELNTGGFSARYGDRLSGVFNMRTRDNPDGKRHSSVGVSVMNARLYTDGALAAGNATYMVSARRSMLDVVLPAVGQVEVLPRFYDTMGKLTWSLGPDHVLSLHALHSGDRTLVDNGDVDFYDLRYRNTYAWLTLRSFPSADVHVETALSTSFISQDRSGFYVKYDYTDKGTFEVSDRRTTRQLGLRQDWRLDVSDAVSVRAGLEALHEDARYDYSHEITDLRIDTDEQLVDFQSTSHQVLSPSGQRFGAYLTPRVALFQRVFVEPGVRFDYTTYTGEALVSPRIAAALAITDRTFLRTAWGIYYQSPYLYDLDVEHGVTAFDPAARADHYVAGLEHRFDGGLEARVEAYYKRYTHLPPRWVNLRDQWEVFPEARNDNVLVTVDSATARGIELFLKYDEGGPLSLWFSYAFAKADDDIARIDFDGLLDARTGTVPRLNDQRHTVNVDLNWRPTERWRFGVAWQYYRGWPRTSYTYGHQTLPNGHLQFYAAHLQYNGEMYPAYHRMDLRMQRSFVTGIGDLTVYLHLINVYNRKNLRKFDLDAVDDNEQPSLDADGNYVPVRDDVYWLGFVPVLGVDLDF